MKNKSFRHTRLCNAVSVILALSVSALCMNTTLAEPLDGNSGSETPVASCGFSFPAPAVKAETQGLRAVFYQDYEAPVTNCYEPDTFIVWDFGDGSVYRMPSFTLAVPEIDHVYENDGDYTVRVYFEKADGQTASEAKEINISLKDVDPVVHIVPRYEDRSHMGVIAGDRIRLDGSTSLSKKGHEIVSYLWSTGETTPEIEITVDDDMLNDPVKLLFSLTVTDETGASQTHSYRIETVEEPCGVPPIYSIWTHFSALNTGRTVSFSDASTDDLGGLCPISIDSGKPINYDFVYGSFSGTEFFWDFGDGSTLTASDTSAEHTYENPGDYTVLYAVAFQDARVHTAAKKITVAEPEFKAVIVPDGINFDVLSDGSEIMIWGSEPITLTAQIPDWQDDSLSYKWSTGETAPSITVNPEDEHTAYSVDITDAQGNTVSADIALLRAIPDCGPVVMAPAVMGLEEFVTAQFDESLDSLTVNLTDRSTMRSGGCAIIEAEFDENDPNVTRIWDFGDGATGEGKNVSHTYEKPGTYTVRLQLTVNDYTTEISREITVRDLNVPVPELPVTVKNATFSIEAGTALTLDSSLYFPQTEGTTYRWSTGESTPIIVVNPYRYKEYTLDVIDKTGAVVNRLICIVDVHEQYNPDLSEFAPEVRLRTNIDDNDRTVVAGTEITIDASHSFVRSDSGEISEDSQLTFKWSNGKTGPVINEVITENTTLTVEVTDPATGLSNTAAVSIKAVDNWNLVPFCACIGGAGDAIRANTNVELRGECLHYFGNSQLTFKWTVDGEVVGDDMILNHIFTQPGTHKLAFSAANELGNTASLEIDVLVLEDTAPVIITGDDFSWIGSEVRLRAKTFFNHLQDIVWRVDGEIVAASEPFIEESLYYVFDSTGRHNVTVEITDDDGIKHTAQYTVNVNSPDDPIKISFADGNESQGGGDEVPFVQSGEQDINPLKMQIQGRMAITIGNIAHSANLRVLKIDNENNTTMACRISENFVVECAASENSNAISIDNGSDISIQFNEAGQYQVYVDTQSANFDEITGYIPLNVVENINEEDDDQDEADDNHESEGNSSEGKSSGGKKGGSMDLFSLMLLAGSSFFLRRRKK
ncbi:PKD domain-containing protein [Succinimonas sp.]|uniref:PKD domain-containing protein n=1 Tax=Succinimonas sp. TaxID=1936151 RepID=UPI0038706E99